MRKRTIAAILILSFLVPAAILALAYAVRGITPFGSGTLVIEDLRRQYLEIYGYYRRVFRTNENFFYSLSMGLGGGTFGLFSYLLTSPFLIPLIFLPVSAFPTALSLIFLAKAGICGLSFAVFALFRRAEPFTGMAEPGDRRRGDGEPSPVSQSGGDREPSPVSRLFTALPVILLSSCYALSSYCIANIYNSMWIDVVALFPLLALCHERMMERERKFADRWTVLYILCVAGALWLNYYIAYMVLLFTAIRTLLLNTGVRSLVRCLLATAAGAGLVMALLLPTAASIAGSAKDTSIMEDPTQGFSLLPWKILVMLLPGQYSTESIFHGLPNVYCGVVPVILFVLCFLTRGTDRRRKARILALFVILVFSSCLDGLNRIWHAGMEPSGYLYRYSFLISFVILSGADEFLAQRVPVRRTGTGSRGRILAVSILLAVCLYQGAELCGNAVHILTVFASCGAPSVQMFAEQTGARFQVWNALSDMEEDLCRAESSFPYTENDNMLYGNYGVTHYSSIQQTDVRNFLIRLGYNDTELYAEYTPGNTHAAEALLGLKYCLYPDRLEQNPALPMAYLIENGSGDARKDAVSEEELEGPLEETSDPFRTAEGLLSEAAGGKIPENPVFLRPEILFSENGRFRLKMPAAGALYLFIEGTREDPQDIRIWAGGTDCGVFGNDSCRNVKCLGEYPEGSEVPVELENLPADWPEEHVLFAVEDRAAADRYVHAAQGRRATIALQSSSHMTVQAEPDGLSEPALVLLIPYDDSWHFALNGKQLKQQRFAGEYMLLPLPEGPGGTVTVTMNYTPRGLYAGIAISVLTVLALVCFAVWQRKAARGNRGRS